MIANLLKAKYIHQQTDLWIEIIVGLDMYTSATKLKSMDGSMLRETLINLITNNSTLKHIVLVMRSLSSPADVIK